MKGQQCSAGHCSVAGLLQCREKWVQGWSSLMWGFESVILTLGIGEGDIAVLSGVLLTQNIDLLFYFLLLPCILCPALFSTFLLRFWAQYCSIWMWDVGSCPVTFVRSPLKHRKLGKQIFPRELNPQTSDCFFGRVLFVYWLLLLLLLVLVFLFQEEVTYFSSTVLTQGINRLI